MEMERQEMERAAGKRSSMLRNFTETNSGAIGFSLQQDAQKLLAKELGKEVFLNPLISWGALRRFAIHPIYKLGVVFASALVLVGFELA